VAFSFTVMKFSESLKKTRDFSKVYKARRSRADKRLVMYSLKNGTLRNRLGISVSKKIGNSVVRHHLTRLIREAYRLNESSFSRGFDIVIVVRDGGRDADFHEIEDSLLFLAKKQHLLESE